MNTTTIELSKQRREVTTDTVTNTLMNASGNLLDLLLWSVENDFPLRPIDKQYGVSIKKEKLDIVAPRGLFRVYLYSDVYENTVFGNIGVQYFTSLITTLYYDKGNSSIIVKTFLEDTYIYPPRDLESILFFLLNPSLEKKIIELLRTVEFKGDNIPYLQDYLTVSRSIRRIPDNTYIPVSFTYKSEAYGSFSIENHPEIKVFDKIEAYYEDKDTVYRIQLNARNYKLNYTLRFGNIKQSLKVLIEKLVPRKEYETLYKLSKEVEEATLRAYLVVKVFEKLKEL